MNSMQKRCPSHRCRRCCWPRRCSAEIIEQILVKVNGEIFTKTDLEQRRSRALRELPKQLDPTRT